MTDDFGQCLCAWGNGPTAQAQRQNQNKRIIKIQTFNEKYEKDPPKGLVPANNE